MLVNLVVVFMILIIIISQSLFIDGQSNLKATNLNITETIGENLVEFEFDETDISKLNLKIKWKINSSLVKDPDRFVLLMEQKRLNLSTFLFDFNTPQLIDDESTIESSTMRPNRFKMRVPLNQISNIDCAMSCINSSQKFPNLNQTFDCNIYYYEPHNKMCVLYQYDYKSDESELSSKYQNVPDQEWSLQSDNIYDYFLDECEIDEILGDVIGFSRYCRRLLDYKVNHEVKINPYIDYRFSLSIRYGNGKYWTPFIRREYHYAPKITIEVRGELKLGKDVIVECKTDLHPSIIDSISWKNNNPKLKGVLKLTPLTYYNMYQTYFCEIRYNFVRMMQKAFKLNITDLGEPNPKLQISYTADNENLNVKINWNITTSPNGLKFKPERIILLYSENNQSFRFVNKYLLFELSNYDNIKFSNPTNSEELYTNTEEECALACLQRNYCEHFVFYKSLEPFKNSKRKNCNLASNTNESLIACRFDSTCANLSPYENHIQNNTVSISILPNMSYKFRIQLRDKHFNWTNVEETQQINLPLKLNIEQKGSTTLSDLSSANKFELSCNTNINKNIAHQFSWLKDDVELLIDNNLYSKRVSNDSPYANSVLEFKSWHPNKLNDYSGSYKCKLYIRYPEVGQATSYISESKRLKFSFSAPLKYNHTSSNSTFPTIPGLLLEISCFVYGSLEPNIKWLIDGVNYSEKKFELLTDEPFVINITFVETLEVNHILVMKMDTARKMSKYECILNNNLTVSQHYIRVVDEKPQLSVQIDNSSLNKLKLSFKLDTTNQNRNLLNGIKLKPLKRFISYVENSTFSSSYQTIIAPETLSKSDMKSVKISDRLPIATLRNTTHGIQSCKLVCFTTPYCKLYEYLMYDDSCNLFSSSDVESYYRNFINMFINSSNSNFNLIPILHENMLSILQEDSTFNNTILIDKKVYPECEQKLTTFVFGEEQELHCSDELQDYSDTYVLDNLIPATTYQFRIEVANVFGKSTPYFTEQIEVPFILNPIVEKDLSKSNISHYSLICSTPIIDTKRLQFRWYRNEQLIPANTTDFELVTHNPFEDNNSNNNQFSSELIFKDAPKKLHGFYTCSLIYSEDFFNITKNESIIFRSKSGPFYSSFIDSVVKKKIGDSWTESCTADGWPLPTIDWYFNNKLISNQNMNSLNNQQILNPFSIVHHRHLTTSSHIVINNLTKYLSGRYSCVVNGKIPIKNITLLIDYNRIIQNKTYIDETTEQIDQIKKEKPNISSVIIPIVLIMLMSTLAVISLLSYFKRKRSNSNTSLSYNRIEEEVISGVDNPTLTDDNQLEPIRS